MSNACQVDFYVLASPAQSAEQLACRLAMMAWEQGHRIAVLTATDTEAATLDEMMWDYPAGRFLPHGRGQAETAVPVSIATTVNGLEGARDLVINLTDKAIEDPVRFTRLLEIVPAAPQKRIASRQKFRAYREIGLEPASHQIG
jgi:DNA polymerase IIIc chi subunit